MPRALVVEDDRSSLAALLEVVESEGLTARGTEGLAAAQTELALQPPDVVITDLMLPDGSGLELIEPAAAVGAQVVVLTGHASVESAVDALRRGATDYLTKPIDLARLRAILANVGRTRELQAQIGTLRGELRKLGRFGPLVGAAPAMNAVYDLIARVAPSSATVCIIGESGTGKEVVAQAVHELSRRRGAPFVPVNCGAVSPQLIETTLFGHERGSFTGAERMHRGVFEQASGGTLMLDEVSEMPLELQVKLLRVLETGTVTRIGGEAPIAVDVRIVAATNRVPEQAIREGRLREDLWYRLNVFPIDLPPLRERGGDVEVLIDHFLAELNAADGTRKRFSDAARAALVQYRWPGNVRELKNLVQRAYILAEEDIDLECLPPALLGAATQSAPSSAEPTDSRPPAEGRGMGGSLTVRVGSSAAAVEQQLILATLEACGGNKQRAAEVLGLSLKTIYNRLTAYKDPSRT